MGYQKENESTETALTNVSALLNRKIKRMDLHLLISICSLVIILFLYFFIQESLNLLSSTIFLIVVFSSLLFVILPRLKMIETFLNLGKNVESAIAFRREVYTGLHLIAIVIVLLITSFVIAIFILVLLSFFVLNELKIVFREGKLHKLFLKFPIALFSILLILVTIGFSINRIPDFFPFLIELSTTFIFTIFLIESLSEIEVLKEKKSGANGLLQEKVKEIFDKKTCKIHPSQVPSMSCLRCNRHICELCKANYVNLCVYCYKKKIENRLLLFRFLVYLSTALFAIFLISFIWGMYAPLPLILRFIEWLGLYYSRFIILFYYTVANFIILISIGGGGIFASRQLKVKINQLESRINQSKE